MSMDDEVSVRLTDEELLERGATLAAKNLHVAALRDKKKADAKKIQGLIDEELDEAERLARIITGQEEVRKQGELFVDDATASGALAKVGEAACTCKSEDVAAIDCPAHGTVPPRPGDDGQAASEEAEAGLAEDPGDDDPADDAEPLTATERGV